MALLLVSKTGPPVIVAGQPATYSITVTNTAGAGTTPVDVTLTDTLPAGATVLSFTQLSGPSFAISILPTVPSFPTGCGCSFLPVTPSTVTATLAFPPGLPGGTSAVFQAVLCLNGNGVGFATNTASVTSTTVGITPGPPSSVTTTIIPQCCPLTRSCKKHGKRKRGC